MADQGSGKKIGNYFVVDELGKGGMGIVYKAQDLSLQRMVALKFLPEHIASDEDIVKRFVREARAAARLNHPNIVTVYQVGATDGKYYIAMEFVEGDALDAFIRKSVRVDPYRAAEITRDIAEALAEAHEAGIVHRDIKPQNVMLTKSGRVKVMDFGLARANFENTQLTAAGQTMGTPQFMAPEQWMDSNVDGRADLFSLGVTLYCMLTGEAPFTGSTPAAIMHKVLKEEPPSVSSFAEDVPPQLLDIVEKLIAKEPANRFQTAREAADQLERFVQASKGNSAVASGFSPPGVDLTLEKLAKADAEHRLSGAIAAAIPETKPSMRAVEGMPEPVAETDDEAARPIALYAGIAVLALALIAGGGWFALNAGGSGGSSLFPESDFVQVRPGSFEMGSPPNEAGRNIDEHLHRVTITKPYRIGRYEVTQEQWESVMGYNPSAHVSPRRPVENVSWEDIQNFLVKLNEAETRRFRLPTEAEWEYAARSGSLGAYCFGDWTASLGEYAWYNANSGGRTQDVGMKQPNSWGIHDMHGNVWEWCHDWAGPYDTGAVVDPVGSPQGQLRIGRGGSYGVGEENCRSADRSASAPTNRGPDLGFRLVYE